MPVCSRSRGNGASSSRSGHPGNVDVKMRIVLVKFIEFLSESVGFKVPEHDCKFYVDTYKECVMRKGFNCSFHLRYCPDFNKAEFLRSVSSSRKSETNGKTEFLRSASSSRKSETNVKTAGK
ncbi:uncharacterized protein LOC130756610 isoform X1 [Actinidia eriantha]|uniref:uncharacterized protein LOC130756610 isoform X1 n=1 Tax=Actinidia eriantha TaxID=165200 RepID=UPI00258E9157|nr:uncharacterized protein LOC130756610 isoform X1 [Actinidia eriantha]XP_057467140.1 uncharacterized protein LOC130756610 isoform X1 [Actinidia eriantha]XP_057467141.1 uncharacterized protein LOC130756610 isoform X1 [Actinidia eriantha]